MDMFQRWYLTNTNGNKIVRVCHNVTSQAKTITKSIKKGLQNDEAVIVIAKPAVRKAVILELNELDLDVQAIKNQNQIKFFDAEFLLSGFMNEGALEEQAFQEFVGAPIQATQLKFGKVRVFSEMADFLWRDDQHSAALQLEGFWRNLSKTQEFSLFITYMLEDWDSKVYDEAFEKICEYHSDLVMMENRGSIETTVAGAMQDFEAAWNRVTSRLAKSKRISTPNPMTQ